MKLILSLVVLCVSLLATDKYTLRASIGKATLSDFSEIIVLNWEGHPYDLKVYSIDGGYLLKKSYNKLPLDFYLRSSLSYFDENNHQDDVYEITTYCKAYWNFLNNKARFGFGEGVSYTSAVLATEILEARSEGDTNSKFLNYLDVSLDVNIGKIFFPQEFEEFYIGWVLKHRSGIFGIINNVRRGGSNYNCIYLEKKF